MIIDNHSHSFRDYRSLFEQNSFDRALVGIMVRTYEVDSPSSSIYWINSL
jgi:hypothetical protein